MELIREQKRDWDELGKMDPLWAVLSDPQRQHGRWDIEEFFDTGERDVAAIFNSAAHLSQPRNHDRALDFGCAVGRLTRALAPRFAECWGVDISEAMVRRAQELNRDISNCNFVVNAEESLGRFQNDYFDFVLSILVLQHLRNEPEILATISELLRVLCPDGLLVFQLPTFMPLRNRLQPRRRAYKVLRSLGFDHGFLYESFGLNPIRMNYIPESRVREFVARRGGKVLREDTQQVHQKGLISSTTFFVTK
jgi:SAM-dependent methyltransferase